MKERLLVGVLVLLATISLLPVARADYNVRLQGDTFRVAWTIDAVQNLTSYPISATVYPNRLNVTVTGADLAQFSAAVQKALQSKDTGITISDASLHLSSNNISSTCLCNQWLNATASFQVHETPHTQYGVSQYDMSWMALRLNDDLSVSGVHYNQLGQDYLLEAITPFTQFKATSDTSLTMMVNGAVISKIGYQPLVTALVLFDVSAADTPLENWSHSTDLKSQFQTWNSPNIGGFSFTATEHYLSENTKLLYLAGAEESAQISAGLNAGAKGDTLIVDYTGGLWEEAALVIVLASIAIFASTFIMDRRLTGSYRRRKTGRG